jgi:hypothetical protein
VIGGSGLVIVSTYRSTIENKNSKKIVQAGAPIPFYMAPPRIKSICELNIFKRIKS